MPLLNKLLFLVTHHSLLKTQASCSNYAGIKIGYNFLFRSHDLNFPEINKFPS